MPRTVMVLVSMLAALVLAGCGGGADSGADSGAGSEAAREPAASSPTTSSDPAAPESDASPSEEGDAPSGGVPESLDFTGTTVAGDAFEGASLQGRPTLLWFWAPWCPTCRGQIPQVQGIAGDHAGELNVIGVGSLDSSEAIADFAGDVAGITHLEDVDGELWQRFGVTEQSSFVLLDEEGTVAFEAGYGGTDELDARVADVLG